MKSELPPDDLTTPECEPARAALQRLLDGTADWDDPIAMEHRAICQSCREEVAVANMLTKTHVFSQKTVSTQLTDQIYAGVLKDRDVRKRSRLWISVVTAASIGLISWQLINFIQKTPEANYSQVATQPEKFQQVAEKPLEKSFAEAQDAVASLATKAAESVREPSNWLASLSKPSLVPNNNESFESLDEVKQGAEKSVQPIATSARRAMNLFLSVTESTPPKVQ